MQPVFTARCTLVQSAVLRSHVVRPSVRLSVTFVDCDHIGLSWNSSKIISRLVSLGSSLSADLNIIGLLQGEHLEILAGIGVGWVFSSFKRQYLVENGSRYGQRYY